ncbi:class I SAM-dependent methyltransferase [Rhabdaerophilum calidifontis]|uniref:class I SAM-dependent methyltransferase n=1 Tax=Rhabdaerophilum calidifontis TaxID=2604328 RepID=UPI00123AAC48
MARVDDVDSDRIKMSKAYGRWAPIYDAVYVRILKPGQLEAVRLAMACGPRILEVGVGTGLSLGYYPAQAELIGVDLSKAMLDKAAEKVAAQGLRQVKGLAVMDACRLGFPAARFDAVVSQYVITLVPDPEAALDEFARVVRPGGEIVLVNHLGADGGVVAAFEDLISPLARKVGWSTDFRLARIRAWAERAGFRLVSARKVAPVGFFTVIRLKDERAAQGIAASAA